LQTYDSIPTLAQLPGIRTVNRLFSPLSRLAVPVDAATGELLAAAPRLTTTSEELAALVQECVADDTLMMQLYYQLLIGDYAGFIADVQALPADTLAAAAGSSSSRRRVFDEQSVAACTRKQLRRSR